MDFQRDIQPILQNNCFKCHSGEKPKSNFRLTSRQAALRGGDHAIDIVPGQSAKSPLIYAVAGALEDMEMPPPGRGTPLTPEQIGLLRAWIDQGVAWADGTNELQTGVSFSPTIGWTTVDGDHRKFRELYWQHEGWNGGLEQFEITERPGPDTKITSSGHVLRDDYKLTLSAEKNGLGFTRFGWAQFRKYYDDTGGYYPLFNPSSYSLNRDLNLDIGRAWADVGLALPFWPTIVLGYEYQYRDGTEATLQWGPVNSADPRSIYPGFKRISERVHILKLDVDYDFAGFALADSFRGEWYHLATGELDENLPATGAASTPFTRIDERQKYFQGANAFHIEKQFTEGLFGAGGYLYSKLDADGSMNMAQQNVGALDPNWPLLMYAWNADAIELERESHVFSLSGLAGPWEGLTLSLGTQNEWTRQTGFGIATPAVSSTIPFFLPPPTFTQLLDIQNAFSSLDHRVFSQNAGLRFTQLPFTTLYADARIQQESYGQFEQETGGVFPNLMYRTDASSHLTDVRAGFETSPWRRISLSGQFRRSDNSTDYDNLFKQVARPNEGYPAFIHWRDLLTTQAQTKLAMQWTTWFKTSLSYDWVEKHYRNAAEPVTDFLGSAPIPGGITTGAPLLAGAYDTHTASLNATLTPSAKLVLSATLSFQNARTITEANDNPAVAPYAGNIYSVLATGSYALDARTSLVGGYGFSTADFAQPNLAAGLPLGLTYHQHTLQAGVKRQLSKNTTLGLQYRFYYYDEPSRGGLDNFVAHGFFATLACRLP